MRVISKRDFIFGWLTVAKVGKELKINLASTTMFLCNASMSDADRLTRLEERYAHLQRHVVEQDKAMLELGETIVKLRKEIALLRAQAPSGGSDVRDAAEERPPHY